MIGRFFLGIAVGLLAAANGSALAQVAFTYYAPGDLASGRGRLGDREIYFPNMKFPLSAGLAYNNVHAYANSQIHPIDSHSVAGNYRYPWRDTYCEERSWDMPLCPGKTGHQGVDIRPHQAERAAWPAFAMEDSIVTSITHNTTVTLRSTRPNDEYYCRYLHLDYDSIIAAGLKVNGRLKKGDLVGKVSNIMGGKPATSIHLHFDCYKIVNGTIVRLPVYTSLISSYRMAWGLDTLNNNGQLGIDAARELSGSPPVPMPIGPIDAGLPKTFQTRNYGAITPQTEPPFWPQYIRAWPGLVLTVQIRDKFGKIIPAFANDEAGIGLWWYWMVRRAGFGTDGNMSFEQIAFKYSGVQRIDDPRIDEYASSYSGTPERPGVSRHYFGRYVPKQEMMSLADKEMRWRIAQTLFHHEAGRQMPFDRAAFERGIQVATAVLEHGPGSLPSPQPGTATPAPMQPTGGTTPAPPGTPAVQPGTPGTTPIQPGAPSGGLGQKPGEPQVCLPSETSMELIVGKYVLRLGNSIDAAALARVIEVLNRP